MCIADYKKLKHCTSYIEGLSKYLLSKCSNVPKHTGSPRSSYQQGPLPRYPIQLESSNLSFLAQLKAYLFQEALSNCLPHPEIHVPPLHSHRTPRYTSVLNFTYNCIQFRLSPSLQTRSFSCLTIHNTVPPIYIQKKCSRMKEWPKTEFQIGSKPAI